MRFHNIPSYKKRTMFPFNSFERISSKHCKSIRLKSNKIFTVILYNTNNFNSLKMHFKLNFSDFFDFNRFNG